MQWRSYILDDAHNLAQQLKFLNPIEKEDFINFIYFCLNRLDKGEQVQEVYSVFRDQAR